MDIKEALAQMDPLDDDQWTKDGAPKLDTLGELMGEKPSREDVMEAAPEFSKENPVVPEDEVKDDENQDNDDEVQEEPKEVDLSVFEDYLEDEPMPEKEFIAFLMDLDPSALATFETILVEQQAACEAAVAHATDLKNRVKRGLSYTRNRIKHEVPDMDNQQAIQNFIKSQTEARGAKIAKTKELLQGVDLKQLDPRAAIDKAMARKNNRGGKRPTRGLMNRKG